MAMGQNMTLQSKKDKTLYPQCDSQYHQRALGAYVEHRWRACGGHQMT